MLEAGGTGVAFASFPVTLPDIQGALRFRCQVAMDKGAVGEGKTDGVTYRVKASAAGVPDATAEILNATAMPAALELDLGAFRGKAGLRPEISSPRRGRGGSGSPGRGPPGAS